MANPDFSPQWRRSRDVNPTDKLSGLNFTSLSTDQMHTDNKLTNHGKEVTNDRRSQVPSVNQPAQHQGATGTLGPKNTGAGSHGAIKSTQVSPCTAGAKAPGQAASAVGGMLKTKCKRERSIGADGAASSASDTDAKGGESRLRRGTRFRNVHTSCEVELPLSQT